LIDDRLYNYPFHG